MAAGGGGDLAMEDNLPLASRQEGVDSGSGISRSSWKGWCESGGKGSSVA